MGVARTASTRLGFVDVLKGLVMVLVVICHESLGVQKAGVHLPASFDPFINYCYTFFMPLMFFLSGLFEERLLKKGKAEFFLGRARTLVYPFVMWSFITGAMMLSLRQLVNHSISKNPLMWFSLHPIGALWFFEALIICHVVYGTLRYLKIDKRIVAIIFAICSVVGALLYDGNIGTQTLFVMGFFALGACFSKEVFELPNVKPQIIISLAVISEILHVLLMQLPNSPHKMIGMAVFGCGAYLCIGAAVGNASSLSTMRSIGVASLAIYVMHTIVGACVRIVLQKVLGIEAAVPLVISTIFFGLCIPWALFALFNDRFPWLFRWPSRGQPQSDSVTTAISYSAT